MIYQRVVFLSLLLQWKSSIMMSFRCGRPKFFLQKTIGQISMIILTSYSCLGTYIYAKNILTRLKKTPILIIRYLSNTIISHVTDIISGKSKALQPNEELCQSGNSRRVPKWAGDNNRVMQDQNKRIAFGQEYCNPKEWKLIWKAFDKEVSTLWDSFEFINWCSQQKGIHAEKYKNLMTFTVFFTFATPANPLPDIKIDNPQGALSLVTAAANIFLFFYY